MNTATSIRKHLTKALVAAGVAATLGSVVAPMAASASGKAQLCLPTKIFAQHDGQVIHGTCGDDLIKVGQYKNVTIHAHGGNDDVRAGWAGTGLLEVHLGTGNDELSNGGTQAVLAYGDEGNDTMEGSTIYHDVLNGGAGNDTLLAEGGGPSDDVIGGTGTDTAWLDANDVVFTVENKEF
jgi:Ca2+-binding RTX toxin-like protein